MMYYVCHLEITQAVTNFIKSRTVLSKYSLGSSYNIIISALSSASVWLFPGDGESNRGEKVKETGEREGLSLVRFTTNPPQSDDNKLRAHLFNNLDTLLASHPNSTVLVMGDFNQFKPITSVPLSS